MTDGMMMMVLFAPAVAVQCFVLWEMAGYFSFRDSYYLRADQTHRYFDADPDLQRAFVGLGAEFEVRLRPDRVLVRRRHGWVKRLLAHATVVVAGDGYEVRSGAGPRGVLGVGAVIIPAFALMFWQYPIAWPIFAVAALVCFLGCRSLLRAVARRFGDEVSAHL